jgi:protease I
VDPSPQPAAGKDDKAAIAAVTHVYTIGLQALKKQVAERKSIHQVISYYAEGGTRGDAQTVARAFHPSATMKFVKEGRLVDEPIDAFYRNYIRPGVLQQRTVEVDSIDIQGTAAAARLTIDYPTHQFIDYFNLLKIDGEWAIVSKIFHRIPKP